MTEGSFVKLGPQAMVHVRGERNRDAGSFGFVMTNSDDIAAKIASLHSGCYGSTLLHHSAPIPQLSNPFRGAAFWQFGRGR